MRGKLSVFDHDYLHSTNARTGFESHSYHGDFLFGALNRLFGCCLLKKSGQKEDW